jgi:hypothetical protein
MYVSCGKRKEVWKWWKEWDFEKAQMEFIISLVKGNKKSCWRETRKKGIGIFRALFDNERRRSECVIWASVPNTSSRIEVCRIFFETNIMSDLSYTLWQSVNRINSDLFPLLGSFQIRRKGEKTYHFSWWLTCTCTDHQTLDYIISKPNKKNFVPICGNLLVTVLANDSVANKRV